MVRKIVLFAALLAAGLIAGGQYVVFWDYHPDGMTAAFYTQKMQHAIRVIGMPLFAVQISTALLSIALAIMARRERPNSYLLIAAAVCAVVAVTHTALGNIPLLNQIATWNISSPPHDWNTIAIKWWWIHTSRLIFQIATFVLLLLWTFRREDAGR